MMTSPIRSSSHRLVHVVAVAAVAILCACRTAPATPAPAVSPDTWAVVDGRPISRDDVDKAFRRTPEAAQGLSDEEALTARLSLLNDLIVQDIILAKAKALKLDVPP